ncbi:MAG: hypothetical protein KDI45_11210 [Candidatus Accumulibacter sp.]|nr:hypothetical protein [Accumulibacter sp.]
MSDVFHGWILKRRKKGIAAWFLARFVPAAFCSYKQLIAVIVRRGAAIAALR